MKKKKGGGGAGSGKWSLSELFLSYFFWLFLLYVLFFRVTELAVKDC